MCKLCVRLIYGCVCVCVCVSPLLSLNLCESSTDHPPTFIMCISVCCLPMSPCGIWSNHNWPLYDNIQLLEGRTPSTFGRLQAFKWWKQSMGDWGEKKQKVGGEERAEIVVWGRFKWNNITPALKLATVFYIIYTNQRGLCRENPKRLDLPVISQDASSIR